jgi:hypothetical protein
MRCRLGKNHRGQKEYTKEQRLIKENKQLKKELGHLRKQIARIDLDRYETVTQMCADYQESERFQENMANSTPNVDDLKKEWACNSCNSGYLEIFLYSKMGETYYYRRCNGCQHRTHGKRYTAEVKGILHQ